MTIRGEHALQEHALGAVIPKIAADFPGRIGCSMRNLHTGEIYEQNGSAQLGTASAIKLPILTALWSHIEASDTVEWSTEIPVADEDVAAGSGILQHFKLPVTLRLRDVATLMILLSDNTATNLVLRTIGRERTNELIKSEVSADTVISVERFAGAGVDDAGVDGTGVDDSRLSMGVATAASLRGYLDKLASGEVTGAQPTYELAVKQPDTSGIPRFLPRTSLDRPSLEVAHKPGRFYGVRSDIGILKTPNGTATLAVLVEWDESVEYMGGPMSATCIGRIARAVYDTWLAA